MTQLVYSQPPLATWVSPPGADDGTRTRNLLFTKQLLCQLSYAGNRVRTRPKPSDEVYSLSGSVSILNMSRNCSHLLGVMGFRLSPMVSRTFFHFQGIQSL